MKKIRVFSIMTLFLIILCNSFMVDANSGKINNQIEITLNNADTEIENVISTEEKELFYESELSGDGKQAYTNRDGDYYYYGDTGKLVRFTCNDESFIGCEAKADEGEVKKAAEKYLENLVEDTSYYQFKSIDYEEYANVYSVLYVHEIDGIGTNDIVFLGINNNLELITFSLPRPYAFQSIDNLHVDQEKIGKEAIDIFSKESAVVLNEATMAGMSIVENKDNNINYQVEIKSSYEIGGEVIESLDYVYIPI